jgi:NTP pyrophosphatase (non-canonical NTP hydrolase)
MTQIEQLQQELIDVLTTQVVDLSMMSKIELGDDVIKEIKRLNEEIDKAKP